MEWVVLFFEMQTAELMKVYYHCIDVTSCAVQVRDLFGAIFKILPQLLLSEAAVFKKAGPFVLSHAKITTILFYPWKVVRRP